MVCPLLSRDVEANSQTVHSFWWRGGGVEAQILPRRNREEPLSADAVAAVRGNTRISGSDGACCGEEARVFNSLPRPRFSLPPASQM